MEIKNDELAISKSSWVYQLMSWTGMTRWDEPKEACTLAVMLGWRIVLAALLTINFFVGWIYVLSGSAAPDDGPMIAVVIIAVVTLLMLCLAGVVSLVTYIGTRFEECKRTCPRVRWTEE